MKKNTFSLLIFFYLTSYANGQNFKFNTQIIFEVDGQPVSKKMFYESSFQIVDDKTIIWIYHSPLHNDQRYMKFFIQKATNYPKTGIGTDKVDVTIYEVIDENLEDFIVSKCEGIVNGVEKTMFEVWMNMEENPKSKVPYNFKMRFLNE